MKSLITFILAIYSLALLGQEYEYVPLVREGVEWSYWMEDSGVIPARVNYVSYRLSGEIEVNDLVYKLLYIYKNDCYTGTLVAAMREVDKKIYAILRNGNDTWQEERLCYDFTLEVGNQLEDGYYTLERIELVNIESQWRKQYYFSNTSETWIEGIGSLNNELLYALSLSIPESTTGINYQKVDDDMVYQTTHSYFNQNACEQAGLEDIVNDGGTYLNRANNTLNISGLLGANLTITNMIGKTLYIQSNLSDNVIIDISSWISGTYVVRLHTNKEAVSKKIIKE